MTFPRLGDGEVTPERSPRGLGTMARRVAACTGVRVPGSTSVIGFRSIQISPRTRTERSAGSVGLPGPEIAVLVQKASERTGDVPGRAIRLSRDPETSGEIQVIRSAVWKSPTYRLYGLDAFPCRSERLAEARGVGSRLHPGFAPPGSGILYLVARSVCGLRSRATNRGPLGCRVSQLRLLRPTVLTLRVRTSEFDPTTLLPRGRAMSRAGPIVVPLLILTTDEPGISARLPRRLSTGMLLDA